MTAPPPATFVGYRSPAGKNLVQEWYDSLVQADRDEILDTFNYLASTPVTGWKRPEFDKVAYPLAEVRCKSSTTNHEIRLYGVFDDKVRARFVLLNGTEAKKRSTDQASQNLAIQRNDLLKAGKASTHEFKFEEGITPADTPRESQSGGPRLFKRR